MRTYLILAAAGAALSVATPAAAQFYPQSYGYHCSYGNFGAVRSIQSRIDRLQYQISARSVQCNQQQGISSLA